MTIMLFAFEEYDAEGGANDLCGTFVSINGAEVSALEMAEQFLVEQVRSPGGYYPDNAHAFDLEQHKIVRVWRTAGPYHTELGRADLEPEPISGPDGMDHRWHRVKATA